MKADSSVRYLRYSNKPARTPRIARANAHADPRPNLLKQVSLASVVLGLVTIGWGLAHLPHPW